MIRPFNITQRYFEFFRDTVRVTFPRYYVFVEESATWWMKTLYFTCLYSVTPSTDEKPLDPGLFSIFKNWQAYPNGPVSLESYQVFQDMATLIGDYYSDDDQIEYEKCLQISDAVLNLIRNEEYRKIAADKNEIVNLVRELYLWKNSYIFETKKMFISHDKSLEIEFEKLFFNLNRISNSFSKK